MDAFLKIIANQIDATALSDLKHQTFLFPSRRAGIYFKNYLLARFPNESFFLPKISSIQDFIIEHSKLIIPNELSLMAKLFESFKQFIPEKFEQFHLWGKMILDDFNEIDKYLVDAKKLFESITLQKEIDAHFELDPEKLKFVMSFWKNVEKGKTESALKTNFIETWQILGELYLQFKNDLLQSNEGYEGMAYKVFYQSLKDHSFKPTGKITIAGFNALSIAEEEIFFLLAEQYGAQIHWDADIYYLNKSYKEAGNFLRSYQNRFNSSNNHWHISDFFHHKKINIYKGALKLSQVKTAIQLVEDNANEQTALVLCDESLLFPIFNNLPPNHNMLNLTMGFPLKSSHWYNLLNNIIELVRTSNKGMVKHQELLNILNLSAIQSLMKKQEIDLISAYLKADANNFIYPSKLIKETKIEHSLFAQILSLEKDFSSFIDKALQIFYQLYAENPVAFEPEEKLLFFSLLEQINQFKLSIEEIKETIPFAAYCRLLKQHLQKVKVPFEHADSNALQIMGFLETRSLDFENLVIVAANEGNLPAGSQRMSFIPYNLRKGFGLPTFEEHDAIYAYHFYRLLQRANNINIIYDTQQGENSKEKSRFILQLLKELDRNDNTISEFSIEHEEVHFQANHLLQAMSKSSETIEMLEKKVFSPTAIGDYIQNPMEFYLKHIARLRVDNTAQININDMVIGNIVHKVMEDIYTPFKGKMINIADFESIQKKDFIIQKIHDAGNSPKIQLQLDQLTGKNILAKSFIEYFVASILKNDKSLAPFIPLLLEEKMDSQQNFITLGNGKKVFLTGNIDRVDEIINNGHSTYRVIDYKTGSLSIPTSQKEKNNMDAYFDTKNKYGFQGMFYALLMQKQFGEKDCKVAFYTPRNENFELHFLEEGQIISKNKLADFEQGLIKLIEEILNPEIQFIAKADEKDYKFSDYRDLIGI